jgi:hypothetical protein
MHRDAALVPFAAHGSGQDCRCEGANHLGAGLPTESAVPTFADPATVNEELLFVRHQLRRLASISLQTRLSESEDATYQDLCRIEEELLGLGRPRACLAD